MENKVLLECPVYTVEAALLAQDCGVDRIELCADVAEGGTTPSLGLFSVLRKRIRIPIMVMIRPRGGDFVYTADELDVMAEDIGLFKAAGANGFVFGILTPDGQVNEPACRRLIDVSSGIPCTFHRAIDVSSSLGTALESVIDCGFKRVLTSGGKDSVSEGLSAIEGLLEQSAGRIIVMAGGGTRVEHLERLHRTGYLREIHSSCKRYRVSDAVFVKEDVQLALDPESPTRVLTIDPTLVATYKNEFSLLST
nr:copper homeostasis protein CutC [Cytophagales bacterium]